MIVGTAGHVDHGKTALVRALTGVDTDRLKEEKARGITIDLGFAYMPLDGGGAVGFVDVPGHERLVRTMIAGAAGIDFALLVVAADDGIMPQTREHLEILSLLGLARGIVAVTKCDRVDAARRASVTAEITAAVAGSSLAAADLAYVSSRSGEGIEDLRRRLADEAGRAAPLRAGGAFRLSVDRVFSLVGIGTVATGTALQGHVRVGDEVVVLPGQRIARVRSLHAQNEAAEAGRSGQRLALGLSGSGIGRDLLHRGAWICAAGAADATTRFDGDLRLLATEPRPLRDGAHVHCHVGASDTLARVVVLDGNTVASGAEARVQLVLDSPLPVRHGDLFVLRDASAQRTIGGGRVLDPRAPARRRRTPERLARLDALRPDDPVEALGRLLILPPGLKDLDAFCADRGLTRAEGAALNTRLALEPLGESFVCTSSSWASLRERVRATLTHFHAENAELPGLAGERLRLALGLAKDAFAAVGAKLLAEKDVERRGHWFCLTGHVAELSPEDRRLAAMIVPRLAVERFRPPRVRDVGRDIGIDEGPVRRTCKALARSGALIEVAHDHFFLRATVAEMAAIAGRLSEAGTPFTAAEFRDELDNGRKVAIQILEHFDRHGLTRRSGDLRVVVKTPRLVFGVVEE